MATRNLARTVIEAGRTSGSKHDRRQRRRLDRRDARQYCRIARLSDDEGIAELDSAPVSVPGYISQEDKLGPALRWMRSKCGQLWDDVYSELSQKFCVNFD